MNKPGTPEVPEMGGVAIVAGTELGGWGADLPGGEVRELICGKAPS